MIYGFFGDMGSGKTLTMTKYLQAYQEAGYVVYTNYAVSFPHTQVNKEFLEKLCTEKQDLGDKVVFGFDEFDLWNDSRTSMTKSNRYINYFTKQLRKYNAKCMVATQYQHALDKRLRTLIRAEVLCTSRIMYLEIENATPIEIVIIYNDIFVNGKLKSKKRFCANKYYGLYNTKELITVDG